MRPNVVGKFNEAPGDVSGGEWSQANPSANTLLRANADLSPALVARAIALRLKKLGVDSDTAARMDAQLAILQAKERHAGDAGQGRLHAVVLFGLSAQHFDGGAGGLARHGRSACHFMATWMDRSTIKFTQMGGEGVTWVGQQPFTTEKHVFANLGDGTYFHSNT